MVSVGSPPAMQVGLPLAIVEFTRLATLTVQYAVSPRSRPVPMVATVEPTVAVGAADRVAELALVTATIVTPAGKPAATVVMVSPTSDGWKPAPTAVIVLTPVLKDAPLKLRPVNVESKLVVD